MASLTVVARAICVCLVTERFTATIFVHPGIIENRFFFMKALVHVLISSERRRNFKTKFKDWFERGERAKSDTQTDNPLPNTRLRLCGFSAGFGFMIKGLHLTDSSFNFK